MDDIPIEKFDLNRNGSGLWHPIRLSQLIQRARMALEKYGDLEVVMEISYNDYDSSRTMEADTNWIPYVKAGKFIIMGDE